jgi:GNAT superfamily N-acetyltransferase
MSVEECREIDFEQDLYISVNFSTRIGLNYLNREPDDADDCVYPIQGSIEVDETKPIGYIKCWFIEGDLILRNGFSLMDAFDCVDTSLCNIGEDIIDLDSDQLKDDVFGPDLRSNNFLYIEEVFVEQSYRGQKVGLKAIEAAIMRFGGTCAAVLLHAFPLTEDNSKAKVGVQPLMKYYKNIGFEQIEATDFMFKNLCYL